MKHLAVLAMMAIAIGVGACGSDSEDSGGGEGDFLTELNGICESSTQEIIENNLERGYATEEAELLESFENLAAIRADALAQIQELDPSEEDMQAFDEMVAAREDLVAASEDVVAATEEGDEEARAKANEAIGEANAAENEASAELGAEICDEELPEDEAQAAEDVLREFSVTADAATSCDSEEGLVGEAFLEGALGGVEKCEKDQEFLTENPDQLPEDISVDRVTGVDGLAAVIEYEDVGGKFDGEPARATLYNLDAGWQIYEIAPAG